MRGGLRQLNTRNPPIGNGYEEVTYENIAIASSSFLPWSKNLTDVTSVDQL